MIRLLAVPLVECPAGALLRPVRTDGAAVTADGRALEVQAGSGWRERWAAQGELPLGSATVTDGGDLPAAFLVHAVVASEAEPATIRSVELALRNALRRAEEWALHDLGMPLLGLGPGALDPHEACRLMAPLLEEHDRPGREEEGERLLRVCVPPGPALEAARDFWREVASG